MLFTSCIARTRLAVSRITKKIPLVPTGYLLFMGSLLKLTPPNSGPLSAKQVAIIKYDHYYHIIIIL